jgi:hypothetical protein
MQQFFENNWLSILSIVIGILVAYVFYRLQKKDSSSASTERKKRATAELLDVVESYIINKQRVSAQVIINLIVASERDHQVSLRPECTSISLLQDVALRLQRSRHLDIPQKSEYSDKIDELIKGIRADRQQARNDDVTSELAAAIDTVKQMIPEDRRAEASQVLASMALLARKQTANSADSEKYQERFVILSTALLGVMAALATALIGDKAFSIFTRTPFAEAFSKIFPLMGLMLAVFVGLAALTTAIRIRRRGVNPPSIRKPDA